MSTVTVGDVELYYEEHGSGDPPLLIMGPPPTRRPGCSSPGVRGTLSHDRVR
jgi:hypothetical protein